MDEQEEWRDIPGYVGAYRASSLGQIMRLPRTTYGPGGRVTNLSERILRPTKSFKYLKVGLVTSRGQEWRKVHRLVCTAFHPNPQNKPEVAHNDGDPLNNRADNLRWATSVENNRDKHAHGTTVKGESCQAVKLTAVDVREIRQEITRKIHELAERYQVQYTTIYSVVTRRTWKHIK